MRTTIPILPSTPQTLRTQHLLLRPFAHTDLPHFVVLRRQPEVMKWTSTSRCDEMITQTKEWMARFLPCENPRSISFSIEEIGHPREVIGSAGCNLLHGKQPEIGYMFRKEVWGRGYATEAVRAVLEAYWGLDRKVMEVAVDLETNTTGDESKQEPGNGYIAPIEKEDVDGFQIETLLAVTEAANVGSRRILEKFGFVKIREFRDWETGGTECVDYILRRPEG